MNPKDLHADIEMAVTDHLVGNAPDADGFLAHIHALACERPTPEAQALVCRAAVMALMRECSTDAVFALVIAAADLVADGGDL